MTTTEQLEVSRLIRASREKVFAAWTDPDMIVQWWGAGDVRCTAAEMDLRVDGPYRIANQTPDGNVTWISGTFTRIDPPSALTYTWAMEPITSKTDYSIVDVSFDAAVGGTIVCVSHTRIVSSEAREMNLAGWIGCLDGLASLLQRSKLS